MLLCSALGVFLPLLRELILWIFGVPLSMVRTVGGIILISLGFELFSPSNSGASMVAGARGSAQEDRDVAFIPLRCRSCLDREPSRPSLVWFRPSNTPNSNLPPRSPFV